MRSVQLRGKSLLLVDQKELPNRFRLVKCKSVDEVSDAIKEMRVRGAPALGVTAALALALVALRSRAKDEETLLRELERAAAKLRRTRPTAVSLFAALDRVLRAARVAKGMANVRLAVLREAKLVERENAEANERMGEYGAALTPDGATVLTHCNTGPLACVEHGTALGAIRTAKRQGKRVKVIVTETRPLLQGARLTTWELKREGVPVTVITDGMVGEVMRRRMVDLVMVGADRIAANGDVANKIGTYPIALLAREHRIPFYVVAPASTIDTRLRSGGEIPIEERAKVEVTHVEGVRVVPKGIEVFNPAFDITPAQLVTAFVTEKGVVKPNELRSLF